MLTDRLLYLGYTDLLALHILPGRIQGRLRTHLFLDQSFKTAYLVAGQLQQFLFLGQVFKVGLVTALLRSQNRLGLAHVCFFLS